MPASGDKTLRDGLGNITIGDAFLPLERLRARKTRAEIEYLRLASDRVVEAMQVAFAACKPGRTKAEITETLRRADRSSKLQMPSACGRFGSSARPETWHQNSSPDKRFMMRSSA